MSRIALALLLLGSASALEGRQDPPQKALIKVEATKGTKYVSVESRDNRELDTQELSFFYGENKHEKNEKSTKTTKGKKRTAVEILEVEKGRPTKVRMVLEETDVAERTETTTENGESSTEKKEPGASIKGLSVVLSLDEKGHIKVEYGKGSPSEEDLKDLKKRSRLQGDPMYRMSMPNREIKVGETWSVTEKDVADELKELLDEFTPDQVDTTESKIISVSLKITGTLNGLKAQDQETIAELEIKGHLELKAEFKMKGRNEQLGADMLTTMTLEMKGDFSYANLKHSVTHHRMVSKSEKGKAEIKGTIKEFKLDPEPQGVKYGMKMKAEGTIEDSEETKREYKE